MTIKTFGELEDGAIFELAQAQAYGSAKRYIKCLEMAGQGNCVAFDNPNQSMLVPADVKVIPSLTTECDALQIEINQRAFKQGY